MKTCLRPKQQAFVHEYLLDLNPEEAALRAGYSRRSASNAADLLRKPEIAAAVHAAVDERNRRTALSSERVLMELSRIAFGDIRQVLAWGPDGLRPLPSAELDPAGAALIAEISESASKGLLKIKRYDKLKALELLGRHLGIFEATGKADDPIHTQTRHEIGPAVRALLETLGGLKVAGPVSSRKSGPSDAAGLDSGRERLGGQESGVLPGEGGQC